jgi:hypothetical protein
MFLWSVWYIICIFLILFELVMNLLSTKHFLEFLINRQHFCYRGWTYPEPLTSGPGPRQLPRWHLTRSKYLTHLKNSQIKFKSDDLMQIGTCGGVVSRPRILSNSGENFFALVLLEMIEISQGFKNFWV